MNTPKKTVPLKSEFPAPPDSIITGAPPPHQMIKVYLLLRYRSGNPGLPTIDDYESQKPHEVHEAHETMHLSADEFESLYGAHPQDIEKVKSFALENRLQVIDADASQRMLTLIGTATDFNRAFSIYLVHFLHGQTLFRGHRGPLYLPEELADIVTGVFGLDNRLTAQSHVRAAFKSGNYHAVKNVYTPTQIADIYHFPKNLGGKNQSIAIIELGGGYYPGDISAYFSEFLKQPTPNIKTVPVGCGRNLPGKDPKADMEVQLDIEILGAVAPQADIYVYFAPGAGAADFLKAVKQAVHSKEFNHSIISISWGMSEHLIDPATLEAFEQTFREAAAKGITIIAAAGDYGSCNSPQNIDGRAHVDYPASSPYVLGCGGTALMSVNNKITAQTTWNDGFYGGATGGGVSEVFSTPSYQKAAGLDPQSVNPGEKTGRGVPDVSAAADPKTGYIIRVNQEYKVAGGTSAAAPLWAGLIALINEKLKRRTGFLNPFLYKTHWPDTSKNTAKNTVTHTVKHTFNSVKQGNNSILGVPGYSAAQGWNACTGWGSPNGENLLEALENYNPSATGSGGAATNKTTGTGHDVKAMRIPEKVLRIKTPGYHHRWMPIIIAMAIIALLALVYGLFFTPDRTVQVQAGEHSEETRQNKILALEKERDACIHQVEQLIEENRILNHRLSRIKSLKTVDEQGIQDIQGIHSLSYALDTRKKLKEKGILKRNFLSRTKLIDVSPEHFPNKLDLRTDNTITVSASRLGLEKLKEVLLLPNFYKKDTDYKIDFSEDRKNALLTLLDIEKFKFERVVIAVK